MLARLPLRTPRSPSQLLQDLLPGAGARLGAANQGVALSRVEPPDLRMQRLPQRRMGPLGQTNGIPFWLVGEFTTHFRTYFSGSWDVQVGR